MNKMNIGIIGGGINSAVGRAHVSALNLDGNWRISTGFFSRSAEINSRSATFYGVESTCYSIEQFINESSNKLDAVLVLTPTPTHFEIISKLMRAGFNVISEKSLTASVFDSTELMNIANQLKKKLYVTFNYTGYPMIREIRRRVEMGQIGNLHTVDIEMPQDGFIVRNSEGRPNNIQDWRKKDYEIPTVSLDLGVHVLSLMHFLTKSEFSKLVAAERHSGIINKVVDNVHVIGQLQNGADVSLSFGKVFSGEKNNISIRMYGDKGSIKWMHHQPDRFIQSDSHGEKREIQLSSFDLIEAHFPRYNRFKAGHPTGFIEAFGNYYEDLRTALLGEDSSNVFAAEIAVLGMKELDAIHKSALQSKWINLNE